MGTYFASIEPVSRSRLNRYAQGLYLDLLVAKDYPEQEPAHKCARWHDLLWFVIPIVGFQIFLEAIRNRYERQLPREAR